jgi:hypothetical protein
MKPPCLSTFVHLACPPCLSTLLVETGSYIDQCRRPTVLDPTHRQSSLATTPCSVGTYQSGEWWGRTPGHARLQVAACNCQLHPCHPCPTATKSISSLSYCHAPPFFSFDDIACMPGYCSTACISIPAAPFFVPSYKAVLFASTSFPVPVQPPHPPTADHPPSHIS